MPITLAEVQAVAQDPITYSVIDELRRSSPFLLNNLTFEDTAIPDAFGSSLTKAYTRQKSTRTASTRQENTEYPVDYAELETASSILIPLGAAYNIDRVYAGIGAVSQVAFQQGEAVKATVALFNTIAIRGVAKDFSQPVPEFDGIDKIVTGTITEYVDPVTGEPYDGTGMWDGAVGTEKAKALKAKRALDDWLSEFDGEPTVFLANRDGIRWLDGINDALGRADVTNSAFGAPNPTFRGIPYVNLGATAAKTYVQPVMLGSAREEPIIQTDSDGITNIYAIRLGLDGVHAYSAFGAPLVKQFLPDFSTPLAVKRGEVEMGPVGLAVKKTRSAGVFRVKVDA